MKVFKILAFCLVVVLVVVAFRIVPNTGIFRSIENVAYGTCETLPGPVGPEDVTVDQELGLAFISANDNREFLKTGASDVTPNGKIWSLALKQQNPMPVAMKHDLEGPFHPHGIALYKTDSLYELYVVNHLGFAEHAIDVFEIISPTELKHRKRIQYPELISPNDIIVLAQDKFLVSNDHGNPRGTIWEKVEVFMTFPWSSVSYFDGQQGHIVVEGLRMANGLALSADNKTLYIAESTGGRISRYQQGDSPLEWAFYDALDIGAAVDNLEWFEGRLLTGAHPRPLEFMLHAESSDYLSPSEVIEIDVSRESMTSKTLFMDDGRLVSGSSVAARFEDQLLIGVVLEEQLTICK